MGLFNRLRNNSPNVTQKTNWDNLSKTDKLPSAEEIAAANRERQEKKLIQVLLPGEGNPDINALVEPREAGPNDKDIVLTKIAAGQIGRNDFEKTLNMIKGPLVDRAGNFDSEKVVNALGNIYSDKHQLKILAYASDMNVNEDYNKMSAYDVQRASETYQNPIQFEEKMEPFMTFLAEHNSPQKVAEYQEAMDALGRNLFGKKYEYFQRIKELQAESARIYGAPRKTEELGGNRNAVNQNVSEIERSRERLVKNSSYYQISRSQARAGERAAFGERLPVDASCEDSSFQDPDAGLFGVFDGAGGHDGGRLASGIGAQTVADLMMRNGEPRSPSDLADWLDEASRRIHENPSAGFSTGTLAKIVETNTGNKAVLYAQVGDSRLYIVHPNGHTELVTNDEGFENKLSNALGGDKERTCVQAGYRTLQSGDKLVLCSDGITGDKGTDLMSAGELRQTVLAAGDTAYAAQALVHQARKNDDRTAIVVEV